MRCRLYTLSCFIPILFLVLICPQTGAANSRSTSTGGQLVRQTCRRAARSNPFLNFNFCVTSLEADPRSSTADLRGLGVIITSLAEANATETEKKILRLLAEASHTQEKNRLEDCKDMYSDAFYDLKDAEAAFYSKKYGYANDFLGVALDNAVDCEDSWQDDESAGHSSPLTTENYNYEQLCRIGLAITAFFFRPDHFAPLI